MTRLGQAEAATIAALVEEHLPDELRALFDASFVRSARLHAEFVYRLTVGVLREIGLDLVLTESAGAEEVAARAKLQPDRAAVPLDWMLRLLAARGLLETAGDVGAARYRLSQALPSLDPAPLHDEQQRIDPSWMPAYILAETAAREYPAFLRGEVSGEEILFSARRLRLWIDYFSNHHRLYAVNNRVGAAAVDRWLRRGHTAILELGGGLGSGALALLEQLDASGRLGTVTEYRFTEPVAAFLRRGEQALRARYPALSMMRFERLDMNQRFAEQGIVTGSVSLVYAVNTLHVARDLHVTLRNIFTSLAPGGLLVIAECVRPYPLQPIDAEFVFNLMETFRAPRLDPVTRPNGGFLTPEQWRAAMEAAGFTGVHVWPDIISLRRQVPEFTVAAVVASRP